jgi:uncharacterized membrane protein
MIDVATWISVGISGVALVMSLWTRLMLRRRNRLDAIHQVLNHWETGSRLRNVTTTADPYYPGLSKSVKTWREVCQKGIVVLRKGPQRDMIREAQKAAIPVDGMLDGSLSGGAVLAADLDKALAQMQDAVETQMTALARTVRRPLEPRHSETYP